MLWREQIRCPVQSERMTEMLCWMEAFPNDYEAHGRTKSIHGTKSGLEFNDLKRTLKAKIDRSLQKGDLRFGHAKFESGAQRAANDPNSSRYS